ncbi:MAG TPA: DUF4249 domain-containing protein [Bacteroidales bacterium]|nr:DUF4249 domain-containing protein [Bacteroidales bacterium]HSA44091.1 DUF4249 domain-containing protein [Bacteroidales bacterium]
MKAKLYIHITRRMASNFLAAVFMLSMTACTERIELELDSTFTRLVVDGAITTDTTAHCVRLTKSTDFYYSGKPPAVSGAQVSISDGEQVFVLTEDSLEAGLYKTTAGVFGIAGRNYRLRIDLAEAINGQSRYEAECMLPQVEALDSIKVVYQPAWEAWIVQCYALDPPTVNYYMFHIYKNGILMTDTIDKVIATDDVLFNGSYTNGVVIGFLQKEYPREIVNPGDVITARIAGITREYLEFIWAVQIETGYKNPLISGPPANIRGNIKNGGIGFFAAYSTRFASCVFQP